MYAKIYKDYLFPFYETSLRRRKTLTYLEELEKNQWRSEGEIKAIQWRKLKKLLDHSYENVPYYRKKFDELGLRPDDIKTYADLAKLPVMTRDDIRDNQEELVARNYKNEKLLLKTTSGTSGVPLMFKYERAAYEWHMAAAARSDRWAGWEYGAKELYIWGRPPYKVARLKKIKEAVHHMILRRKVINTFSLAANNLSKKISEMNKFKAKVIIGYAGTVYNLARFIRTTGVKAHKPEGIITSAEKLFPSQREVIEAAFGTKVFDRYGCQEVMLIASECDKHEGMHMNIDNLCIEILKNGKSAECGEAGDVVITDLNNFSMPFIRYKNGDRAVLSDKKCSCGRGLPLLDKVEGRSIDTIVTSGGRIVSGEVFLYILDRFEWVRKFKAIQTGGNSFTIRIVQKSGSAIAEDLVTIESEIKSVFGKDSKITFDFVEHIPLEPSGKDRMIVTNVPVSLGNG